MRDPPPGDNARPRRLLREQKVPAVCSDNIVEGPVHTMRALSHVGRGDQLSLSASGGSQGDDERGAETEASSPFSVDEGAKPETSRS